MYFHSTIFPLTRENDESKLRLLHGVGPQNERMLHVTMPRELMGSFAPELDFAGYSQDTFYTRAKDGAGHKETWRYGSQSHETLQIPPEVHAALGELRGAFPHYRTNQDVLRDALIHLMHMRKEQLKEPSPDFIQALHFAFTYAKLESMSAEYEARLKIVSRIQGVLSGLNVTPMQRAEAYKIASEFMLTTRDPDFRAQLESLVRGPGSAS